MAVESSEFATDETGRIVSIGLAKASFSEPEEGPETTRSSVSSGLIRAGIGGAVVLLAVIGLIGLIGGFSQKASTSAPKKIAVASPQKPSESTGYQQLVAEWHKTKSQLNNALAARREQAAMNAIDLRRIETQKDKVKKAQAAVDKASDAVAAALKVASAARDNLDDLLGEKLARDLQTAKDNLNAAVNEAEDAQKRLQAAKIGQQRIASTVRELKKASSAAKAAASAADIVATAAKSARLVMAEYGDETDASAAEFADLDNGFFKEATQQADSASRSALVASKALAITELQLEKATKILNDRQANAKAAKKAEDNAYLAFAAADKAFKKHQSQKAKAQDKTEVTTVALASAERRLEEKKDLLDTEAETLQEMLARFSAGQEMMVQHDAKVAAIQSVFEQVDGKLRSIQRVKSIKDAATLATLNAQMVDRLRTAIGGAKTDEPVYDRFILSSESLFEPGSARLGKGGKATIAKITSIIEETTKSVPENMAWMLRVDGHTDATPLSGNGSFKDNWELSQARALSVVKRLIRKSNIPARHLSANGFGEYQPISTTDIAANRRIEIVLTAR